MDTRMTPTDTDDAFWKALSDPTRRQILDLLRAGPRTTGDVARQFPQLSRYAVMKHLGLLETANLVLVRRKGRERWNHLNAVPLREVYERWVSSLEDQWAASIMQIDRLATAPGTQEHDTMISTAFTVHTLAVEQEHQIAAPAATVWSVLIGRMDEWWGPGYRLHDGDDVVISVEARPGGTISERWGETNFASWGTITGYIEGERLEFVGQCGMGGGVYGNVAFVLVSTDTGTTLTLSHHAFGEVDDDTQSSYTYGWNELLTTLKGLAEAKD